MYLDFCKIGSDGLSYLTAIIFLPVIGAILIAVIPGLSQRWIKRMAAVFTLVPLILSVYLFAIFNRSAEAAGVVQFETKLSWIPQINAFYHIGVDGISLPLLLLTAILNKSSADPYSSLSRMSCSKS